LHASPEWTIESREEEPFGILPKLIAPHASSRGNRLRDKRADFRGSIVDMLTQRTTDNQPLFDIVRGEHAHQALIAQHRQHRMAGLLHDGERLVKGHGFVDDVAVSGHHVANRVSKMFQRFIVSDVVGAAKPEPDAYRHLVEAVHDPASCLFVDDRARNIASAAALGFKVVHASPDLPWISAIDDALQQNGTVLSATKCQSRWSWSSVSSRHRLRSTGPRENWQPICIRRYGQKCVSYITLSPLLVRRWLRFRVRSYWPLGTLRGHW